MNIAVQSLHFDADKKLVGFINERIEKLDQYFDKIISADVILKLENSGKIQDKVVEIKLSLPGSTLFSKESSKSFESSADQAVDALRRQIIKYKERLRAH